MKKNAEQVKQTLMALTIIIISMNAFGQVKQPITTVKPTNISQVKVIGTNTLHKSFSPAYIRGTAKFLKNVSRTSITNASNASARSTVVLNKGGSEGSAPSQTSTSTPVKDGDYSCVNRNVNEKIDYFRMPIFGQSEFIYPGALLDASKIINNQFGYYIPPAAYQRQPYRISADLFTMTGTPQNPTEMIGDEANEDFSQASFRNAKSRIMNRNANANPPVDVHIEYIEATTQEEVSVKLGYSFSANIPAELTAVLTGVPVGANAGVSASASASQFGNKSRLILKVNYNFYYINASPTDEDFKKFLSPAAGADVPNNVVYVSSVLYGTTGYIYFESEKSITELMAAVSETVGVTGPAGQGSASVSISAEARAKFSSAVTKMVAFGRGLGIPANSSTQLTNLDQLITLIGSLRNWGPNNQGSPIAYTMNFLKDGVQAVVSYSTQFQNRICTQPELTDLKFDVELELERMDVGNVRDLDGTEDLYGNVEFRSLRAGNKTVNSSVSLFSKSEANANSNNFRNGSAPVDKRINLIKNLSFEELRNLEITVGGKLLDDEGAFGSRVFKCIECTPVSGDYGQRVLKFIEMTTTQSSINSLLNNNQFQMLRFAGDHFFELNFHESGKAEDGKVKFLFKVWVKPHL
ncbi:MAG: thiol-activated cytolysin family protein [Flavisolibacter sp.]